MRHIRVYLGKFRISWKSRSRSRAFSRRRKRRRPRIRSRRFVDSSDGRSISTTSLDTYYRRYARFIWENEISQFYQNGPVAYSDYWLSRCQPESAHIARKMAKLKKKVIIPQYMVFRAMGDVIFLILFRTDNPPPTYSYHIRRAANFREYGEWNEKVRFLRVYCCSFTCGDWFPSGYFTSGLFHYERTPSI